MVLAAARRRIPAALMEADAHLGLANRLAAPFARRVFLSFPIPGRKPPKYRVTGRPIPERSHPLPREEARRRFELPEEGTVLLVAGGSLGARALNDLAIESFGAAGPAVLHLSGENEYERLRTACHASGLPAASVHRRLRCGARRGRSRALTRGRWRLGAGGRRETGDPRSLPARHRRPPDQERAVFPDCRRRHSRAGGRARARAGGRALAARGFTAARGDEHGDAARIPARCR